MGISTDGLSDLKRSGGKNKNEAVLGKPSDYSYGTVINLDTEELKKLGIKDLPKIGDQYRIIAVGEVRNVSTSSDGNGENSSMSIQLTHIKLFHEDQINKAKTMEDKEGEKEPEGESKDEQRDEMMMGIERHIGNFK